MAILRVINLLSTLANNENGSKVHSKQMGLNSYVRRSNEALPTFYTFSVEGVVEAALYCAHRTSTFLSCAFCEQKGHLTTPFPILPRAARSASKESSSRPCAASSKAARHTNIGD